MKCLISMYTVCVLKPELRSWHWVHTKRLEFDGLWFGTLVLLDFMLLCKRIKVNLSNMKDFFG